MKRHILILPLLLALLCPLTAFAQSEQTEPSPQTLPSEMAPSEEDENTYIKTTQEGVQYSVKEDGTIKIEGCRTTAVKLEIPEQINGKTVNEIASAAFFNNSGLISITLPSTVQVIGERAFESCLNLTSVTLGNKLTTIPYRCFASCESLTSVTLPQNLETIEDRAFLGCRLLGKIEIPDTLSEIGEESFYGCEQLILSCDNNPTVKAYADSHRIATSFWDTSSAQLILICGISAIGLVLLLLITKIVKRRKE